MRSTQSMETRRRVGEQREPPPHFPWESARQLTGQFAILDPVFTKRAAPGIDAESVNPFVKQLKVWVAPAEIAP